MTCTTQIIATVWRRVPSQLHLADRCVAAPRNKCAVGGDVHTDVCVGRPNLSISGANWRKSLVKTAGESVTRRTCWPLNSLGDQRRRSRNRRCLNLPW